MTDSTSTKHLEMLQAAITRMAGYSFVAKGWSVTLATAILGLSAKDGGPRFLLIGALAVMLFWLIDAYYLSLEKEFRDLFGAAVSRHIAKEAETFDMTPIIGFDTVLGAAFRPAVLMIHPPLLAALFLAWQFLI